MEPLPSKLDSSASLIISDVDDTITHRGKLLPSALEALYSAQAKGYRTILLSGGSAGWCEVYLRQWPVFMVIAESGAVLIYNDNNNICYQKNPVITEQALNKREVLLNSIDPSFLSSDQYARLYDIAVDLSKTDEEELEKIKKLAVGMGANYSRSSIHLNIWFGDYSKKKGLLSFMALSGIDEALLKQKSIYIGDAPNDEEMFSLIPLSVGMKSVYDMRQNFKTMPKYYTEGYGGDGFAAVIEALPAI